MNTTNKVIALFICFAVFSSCLKDDHFNQRGSNIENFELLWNVIDESYCYFDYKNIDWDSVYSDYYPRITNTLNKYDFFNICAQMLNELKDGHVSLLSDFDFSSYNDFFLAYPQNYNGNIIRRNYLKKDFIQVGNLIAKNIRGIGYLRYRSFMHFVTTEEIRECMNQLGKIDGLIIDIRDNTGGMITMADTILSNFCKDSKTVSYIRYKQGPGHNDFSNYLPKKIEPQDSAAYTGNIAVLTNRLVYSAANDFVSAISSFDNVTLIGDKTGGGGGAPWTSELYNGWQVTCSKIPLYNSTKNHIEFGIEPDIKIDMNLVDEMNGIDSILEYAITFLTKKESD